MENHSKLSSKGENFLVALIAIGLIVFALVKFGYNNSKEWLLSPIVWKDPEGYTISLVDKEDSLVHMKLTFIISNDTGSDISRGEFYAIVDGNYLRFTSDAIKPYSWAKADVYIADSGSAGRFCKAVYGKQIEEIDPEYHVSYLMNEDELRDGDYSFKANRWLKPVLLLVFSALFCFLGISGIVKFQPLRIILKVAGVPMLLIVIIILAGASGKGAAETSQTGDPGLKDRQRRASEEYKRQAGFKAAAEQRGDRAGAARAQREMDKAMADMVGGNSKAAQRYKQYAGYKAGASMTGRTADAARAQVQTDKAMADMIREAKKGD